MIHDISELSVEWLTAQLKNPVTHVKIGHEGRSNVSIFHHLRVEYDSADDSLPRDLFLKLVRVDYPEFFGKELTFYREIVPIIKARHPEFNVLRCYAGEYDASSGRAYLLFEDVSATHTTIAEIELTHYQQIVEGLAMLHATWWGREKPAPPFTAESLAAMLQQAREKFTALRAIHTLDPRWLRVMNHATAQWDPSRYRQMLSGEAMTLVHRDTHPNNFLYPRRSSLRPLIIDWDAWRIDHGTVDLAYMMAFHWTPEQRATYEIPVLTHYHACLLRFGVADYAWEACLQDYKRSILRCLLFMISAWRPERQPGDLWWTIVERGVRAYDAPQNPRQPEL